MLVVPELFQSFFQTCGLLNFGLAMQSDFLSLSNTMSVIYFANAGRYSYMIASFRACHASVPREEFFSHTALRKSVWTALRVGS